MVQRVVVDVVIIVLHGTRQVPILLPLPLHHHHTASVIIGQHRVRQHCREHQGPTGTRAASLLVLPLFVHALAVGIQLKAARQVDLFPASSSSALADVDRMPRCVTGSRLTHQRVFQWIVGIAFRHRFRATCWHSCTQLLQHRISHRHVSVVDAISAESRFASRPP